MSAAIGASSSSGTRDGPAMPKQRQAVQDPIPRVPRIAWGCLRSQWRRNRAAFPPLPEIAHPIVRWRGATGEASPTTWHGR